MRWQSKAYYCLRISYLLYMWAWSKNNRYKRVKHLKLRLWERTIGEHVILVHTRAVVIRTPEKNDDEVVLLYLLNRLSLQNGFFHKMILN